MDFNKVFLLGCIGQEVKILPVNDVKVAKIRMATGKKRGDKEYTQWHNVVAWRKLAESIEKLNLGVGDRIMVEGELTHREYEGKWFTEVVAYSVILVSRKEGGGRPMGGGVVDEPDF